MLTEGEREACAPACAAQPPRTCPRSHAFSTGSGRKSRPATRSLFEYDWIEDKPDLGFVLADSQGAIAGFLATIYADRDTPHGRVRVPRERFDAACPHLHDEVATHE